MQARRRSKLPMPMRPVMKLRASSPHPSLRPPCVRSPAKGIGTPWVTAPGWTERRCRRKRRGKQWILSLQPPRRPPGTRRSAAAAPTGSRMWRLSWRNWGLCEDSSHQHIHSHVQLPMEDNLDQNHSFERFCMPSHRGEDAISRRLPAELKVESSFMREVIFYFRRRTRVKSVQLCPKNSTKISIWSVSIRGLKISMAEHFSMYSGVSI